MNFSLSLMEQSPYRFKLLLMKCKNINIEYNNFAIISGKLTTIIIKNIYKKLTKDKYQSFSRCNRNMFNVSSDKDRQVNKGWPTFLIQSGSWEYILVSHPILSLRRLLCIPQYPTYYRSIVSRIRVNHPFLSIFERCQKVSHRYCCYCLPCEYDTPRVIFMSKGIRQNWRVGRYIVFKIVSYIKILF